MDLPKFSYFAKLMHWGFVLLFIYGVLKQVDNVNQLEEFSLLQFEVMFATVFLLLLAVRFFYMKKTQQSSLPEQTPEPQKLAAKIVHNGMYICLVAIPLSGLMIGLLFWLDLKDGILINIVIEAHEFAVSIIYWLIGIHIVAATYHRLKKDGVWSSMVPVWKEK
jgi:cytochrome b561